MSPTPWEIFALLAGLITIIVLKLAPAPGPANVASTPDEADVWDTPFYLRYNAPFAPDTTAILPRPSPYTFALGVPARPISSQTVGSITP